MANENIATFGVGIKVEGSNVDRDVTRILKGVEGKVNGIGASLSKGFGGSLESSLSGVTRSLGALGPLGGAAGEGLAAIGASAGPIGLVAGGVVALGAGALASIASFSKLTATISQLVAVTGASAESASRIVAVADDVGISAGTITKAFAKLSQGADTAVFKKLGIDIAKTNTGATDLEGTFSNVLRALEKVNDPVERANILQASFGKSYQELLPLITQGADAFERSAKAVGASQVLSAKDLENGKAFRKSLDDVGDAVGRIKNSAGKTLLPIAADTLGFLANVTERLLDGATAVTKFVKNSQAFENIQVVFGKIAQIVSTVAKAIGDITFDDVKRKIQDVIDFADKALGPLVNFNDNVFKLAAETSKANKEFANFRAGERETSAGLINIGEAADDSAAKLDRLAAAAKINDSQLKRLFAGPADKLALSASTRAASDAQETLNGLLGKGLDGQIQTAEAALRGAQSRRADLDATKALADARRNEKEAAKQGGEAEAAARLRVGEATKALAKVRADAARASVDSDERVAAATAKVGEAQSRQAGLARNLEDAQRNQVARHRELETATTAELRAQEAYERTIGKLPASIDAITDALDKQAAARDRIADLSDSLAVLDDQLIKARVDQEQFAASGQAQANESVVRLRIREAQAIQSVSDATRALADGQTAASKGGKDGADASLRLRALELSLASAQLDRVEASRALVNTSADILDIADTQAEKARRIEQLERRRLQLIAEQGKAAADNTKANALVAGTTNGFGVDSPEAKAAREVADLAKTAADDSRRQNEDAALGVQAAMDAEKRNLADVKAARVDVTKAINDGKRASEISATSIAAAQAAERSAQSEVTRAVNNTRDARIQAAAITARVVDDERLRQLGIQIEIFKTRKAHDDAAKAVGVAFAAAAKANLDLIQAGGNARTSVDTLRTTLLTLGDSTVRTQLGGTIEQIRAIQGEAERLQKQSKSFGNEGVTSRASTLPPQNNTTNIVVNNPVGVPTKKNIKDAVNAANSGVVRKS